MLLPYIKINRIDLSMEGAIQRPPKNSGQVFKLQIKQKNAHTKKRKVKTWSPEEDEQLVKLYDEYPKKWGLIASMMQDRNENQCLHRYRRLSQIGAHKKIWSAQEDQTILLLIKKVGKNWKRLAQMLGTKTGKQIRQRFINKLDPKIKNDQWTDQQDKLILKYYSQVGSRWSQISKKLPGRPENKIKNRFYSFIQKNYDIRYVCVDQNTAQCEKQKCTANGKQKQAKSDIGDSLSPLQVNEKIDEPSQNQRSVRMKQLNLNTRQNNKEETHKRRRRNRNKSSFSRFGNHKNQQNIFQDECQKDQTPKKRSHPQHQAQEKAQPQIQSQSQSQPQPQAQITSQKNVSQLPSIKQLQDQFKIAISQIPISRLQLPQLNGYNYMIEEKDEIFDSNIQIGHKFYIKSLIRVEEDFGNENRYRSIRDLVSNGDIQNNNQNQLFYLSHH